jgi:hypothetical protein
MELNSVSLIDIYVSKGFGIGVTLALPQAKQASGTKMLPLDGFSNVTIGALWRGQLSMVGASLVSRLKQHAQSL